MAYLHPDWSPDHTPLEQLVEQARSGPRRYRNALALVLPDQGQFDRARATTRLHLAAQQLLGQRARYGFTQQQVEELKEKADGAGRDTATALAHAYETVVVPVRSRRGETPYALDRIDLRSLLTAGRSLHERVTDALSNRVFSSVTVDKLISLAGLGTDRRIMTCSALVDGFFSFFEFTKIWDKRVVAEAISRAVQEQCAGYVVGLVKEPNGDLVVRDPGLVHLGDMLPVPEIDLSEDAALLSPDYAKQLLEPSPPSDRDPGTPAVGTGGDVSTTLVPGPGPTVSTSTHVPGTQGTTTLTPPQLAPDRASSVQVRATLDAEGLFNLIRALTWLRDADATVELNVTVAARRDDGFDKVALRNRLLEPMEEASSKFEVELD